MICRTIDPVARRGRRHRPRLVRRGDDVHVFEGRCPHRGALLADGRRRRTEPDLRRPRLGLPARHGHLGLQPERADLQVRLPHRRRRGAPRQGRARRRTRRCGRSGAVASVYDRLFDDPHQDTAEEPFVAEIHELARSGLAGPHGKVAAMGVPRGELPTWDDLQILTAQLARFPMLDDQPVDTEVTIGPAAARPLRLRHPGLRLRHELRRALGGGEDGARPRRRGGGHRDLLRRGRHAARGAGRVHALPLRARLGPVRLATRRCLDRRPGRAPQARAGRQDRHRRAPARAPRSSAGSPRSAACPRARRRSRRPGSPTGRRCSTPARSSTGRGSAPAASRSG